MSGRWRPGLRLASSVLAAAASAPPTLLRPDRGRSPKAASPPKPCRFAGKPTLRAFALAGASRPDLVAADMIYSVPPPRNLVSVAFFRFVAGRIGCTATPDSWSLIAFGGRDLRAERVRGHPMVALLGPWRPGWPPRPWSSSWTDLSSHVAASRGCSESSFVLVRASV